MYRYNEIVDATDADKDLEVFTKLNFADDLVKDDVDDLVGKNVVISAYAHQAENIDDVTVADTSAIAWAGVTAAK